MVAATEVLVIAGMHGSLSALMISVISTTSACVATRTSMSRVYCSRAIRFDLLSLMSARDMCRTEGMNVSSRDRREVPIEGQSHWCDGWTADEKNVVTRS